MKKISLLFLLALLVQYPGYSQTISGTDNSVLITALGTSPVVVESKAEAGTYFVAYTRMRYGIDTTINTYGLYLQKVKDGVVQWSNETTVSKLYTGPGTMPHVVIATEDGGCAMVFYHRLKWDEDPTNVFVYKVDASGVLLFAKQLSSAVTAYKPSFDPTGNIKPTSNDVVKLPPVAPSIDSIRNIGASRSGADLIELSNGELVVAWFQSDGRNPDFPGIYINKVNGTTGALTYGTLPKTTGAGASKQILSGAPTKPVVMPHLTLDTAPGADDAFFITYGVQADTGYNVSICKVKKDASTFIWTGASESRVIHNKQRIPYLGWMPGAMADGDGGAIVCYQAKKTTKAVAANSYVQQVRSDGVLRYTTPAQAGQGILLADNPLKSYTFPLMYYYKPRETLIFSWAEGHATISNYTGMGMQRLNMVSGELEWGIAGKTVIEPTFNLDIAVAPGGVDADENPTFLVRRNPLGVSGRSAILLKKLDLNGFEEIADKVVSPTTVKYSQTMLFSKTLKKGIVVWVVRGSNDSQGEIRFKEFTY